MRQLFRLAPILPVGLAALAFGGCSRTQAVQARDQAAAETVTVAVAKASISRIFRMGWC